MIMKDDLAAVLVRPQSTFAERLYALRALLRLGAEGEAATVGAYGQLGHDEKRKRTLDKAQLI